MILYLIYVCVYVCMYVCMYIYVCVCVCVFVCVCARAVKVKDYVIFLYEGSMFTRYNYVMSM